MSIQQNSVRSLPQFHIMQHETREQCAQKVRCAGLQVGALSRALAVATLRLELEYIAGTLEDEALDIAAGTLAPAFMLSRQVSALTKPCAKQPTRCGLVGWQSKGACTARSSACLG